jgi:UrcA family protein
MNWAINADSEEIHMYIKAAVISAHFTLGAVAIAGLLFAGNVAAQGHNVTVAIHVSTQGLDLRDPAGAQKFYARLQHAADVACTHGNRVDLKPSSDPVGCYEKALGEAIRSVNLPLLTQVYLETHTLRQAAAYGIEVPAKLAAKR